MTDINKYLQFEMRDMASLIEWTTSDRMADYKNDDRRDWALKNLRDCYERAFGALMYARNYAGDISEEDYQLAHDNLFEVYHSNCDKVWEIWRKDTWQHC